MPGSRFNRLPCRQPYAVLPQPMLVMQHPATSDKFLASSTGAPQGLMPAPRDMVSPTCGGKRGRWVNPGGSRAEPPGSPK
jgi:hypothetical protein